MAPLAPHSRRAFLTAIGTAPYWTARPATAAEITTAGIGSPPTLPGGLSAFVAAYVNGDGEIRIDATWQVRVTTAGQVADLANWATGAGWRLRAMGQRHNWSPLTPDATAAAARVLLVDTSALTEVSVDCASRRVTAGAGATLDGIQNALKANGLAFAHAPAVGDLSIGGALAIGAHGTGVPASRESARPGWTFGSLSNAVVSLDAVVWDTATRPVCRAHLHPRRCRHARPALPPRPGLRHAGHPPGRRVDADTVPQLYDRLDGRPVRSDPAVAL